MRETDWTFRLGTDAANAAKPGANERDESVPRSERSTIPARPPLKPVKKAERLTTTNGERTMEELSWREWLTETTARLRQRGHDSRSRALYCGHRQSLPAEWVRSVGMWRISSEEEIAASVGADLVAVREFADEWCLRPREPKVVHRVELAEECCRGRTWMYAADHVIDAFEIIGRYLGILPVEVFLYTEAARRVMWTHGFADFDEYLSFSNKIEDRAMLWDDADAFSDFALAREEPASVDAKPAVRSGTFERNRTGSRSVRASRKSEASTPRRKTVSR